MNSNKTRAYELLKERDSVYKNDPEGFINKVKDFTGNTALLPKDNTMPSRDLSDRYVLANSILVDIVKGSSPPEISNKGEKDTKEVAFVTKSTLPETNPQVAEAKKRTEAHRKEVAEAGALSFTEEELSEISTSSGFAKPVTSGEINTAWQLYNSGITKEGVQKAVDESSILTDTEKNSLSNVANITGIFTLQNEDLSKDLVLANQSPELLIQNYSAEHTPPDFSHLIAQSNNDGFSPVLEVGFDFVKDQVEGYVKDTLNNGVKKLVEKGTTTAAQVGVETVGEAGVAAGGAAAAGGTAAAASTVAASTSGGAAAVGAVAATGAAVTGGAAAAGGTAAGIAATEAAAGPPGWAALAVEAVVAIVVATGVVIVKGLQKLVTALTGEKDTSKSIMALSLMTLMGGIAIGSPLLAGVGGFGFAGGAYALHGGISLAGGVAGFFQAAMLGFTNVLLPSILIPFLVGFLGFPLLVIFIIIIIYMGGYVVPPNPVRTTPYAQSSPYIRVEKTAESSGHPASVRQEYENSELPETVTFTITITPLLGSLTNVSFNVRCAVTNDTPNPPDCPSEQDITINGQSFATFPPPSPGIIAASEVVTVTYTQNFTNAYVDSFVIDTFSVTADAPGQIGAISAGSATLCIGDCPSECPSIYPTTSGYLTQGAYTPAGNSHSTMEALDVGVNGAQVFTTHAGIATVLNNSCLGNYIEVASSCEGRSFVTQYAHLEATTINSGEAVNLGQQIAISGNTGTCTTGPHLHYRFKYPDGTNPSYPSNPPFMWNSITTFGFGGYFPQDVPRGCMTCGISW